MSPPPPPGATQAGAKLGPVALAPGLATLDTAGPGLRLSDSVPGVPSASLLAHGCAMGETEGRWVTAGTRLPVRPPPVPPGPSQGLPPPPSATCTHRQRPPGRALPPQPRWAGPGRLHAPLVPPLLGAASRLGWGTARIGRRPRRRLRIGCGVLVGRGGAGAERPCSRPTASRSKEAAARGGAEWWLRGEIGNHSPETSSVVDPSVSARKQGL